MASTFSNFGVPDGSGGRTQMLQPKPKFKFRVRVLGFGPTATPLDMTANTQTVSKPSRENNAVEVHSYNSIAYFQGKGAWNTIDWDVRDDVTNAVTRLVLHQEQKQMNHFEQTTPLAGSNYKFDMVVETMDGSDGVIESWYLEGCFLTSINWGDYDYASTGDYMNIKMTIRYDNATVDDGLMTTAPELLGGFLV